MELTIEKFPFFCLFFAFSLPPLHSSPCTVILLLWCRRMHEHQQTRNFSERVIQRMREIYFCNTFHFMTFFLFIFCFAQKTLPVAPWHYIWLDSAHFACHSFSHFYWTILSDRKNNFKMHKVFFFVSKIDPWLLFTEILWTLFDVLNTWNIILQKFCRNFAVEILIQMMGGKIMWSMWIWFREEFSGLTKFHV